MSIWHFNVMNFLIEFPYIIDALVNSPNITLKNWFLFLMNKCHANNSLKKFRLYFVVSFF